MTAPPNASLGVLGPLTVRGAGAIVSITGERQRRTIGALVAAGPSGASAERLAEAVWDPSDQPADPVPHLRTAVSRVRRQLADAGIEAQAVVESVPGGYRLGGGVDVDAWRFEALLDDAPGTNLGARLGRLDEALELWAGDPFDDLGVPVALQPTSARLIELRLTAEEERLDAWLARGAARSALGRGLALVEQHPYRERLHCSTALAAYRLGRQREALRLLDQHRSIMREEVGLEPGPGLSALEQAILDHAPSLRGPVTEDRTLRGYHLTEAIEASARTERYLATQLAFDRSVVVEVTHQDETDLDDVERFHDRAGALARLRHPNVVRLVDFWREPGASYVVTSPPDRSLADVLAAGPPPFEDRIRWVAEVGAALEAIRGLDMTHERLDPRAIFVDDDRSVIVDLPPLGPRAPADGTDDIRLLARFALQVVTGRAGAGLPEVRAATAAAREPERLAALFVDTRDGVGPGTVHGFLAAMCQHGGIAEPQALEPEREINPYPGLVAFDEATAANFHGRDGFVAELLGRWADPHRRLTVVVGPSGSGKSSVVLAGLVPALRRESPEGRRPSVVAIMRPGDDPFAALVDALGNVATEADADLVALLNGHDPLNALAAGALAPDLDLVVVIDQLEELFVGTTQELRDRFLGAVTTAVNAAESRVRVVATLRADFFDRVLETQPFASDLPSAVVLLPTLTDNELADAIVLPARAEAVEVEPSLVARLMSDTGGDAATLPLLGATLHELFARRTAGRLMTADYDALGGLTAALVSTAEDMVGHLAENQLDDVRHLFGQLVTVEADHQPVRRRVPLADLVAAGIPPAVVDAAIDARLLVVDRDPVTRVLTIAVTHESVLTRWPRLARWLDDDRRMLHDRTELAHAAASWDQDGRDDGRLLRGNRLDRARELTAAAAVPVGPSEQALVAASVARYEAEQAGERRHERRRRRLLALATAVALIAVVAGTVAIRQQRRADDESEAARLAALDAAQAAQQANDLAVEAESAREAVAAERDLAATASAEATNRLLLQAAMASFDDRPKLAIELALAAVETGGGVDAERALVDLLTQPHFDAYLGQVVVNSCVSSSPLTSDPALAVLGQVDAGGRAMLSLWDLDAGGPLATISVPASPASECPALGPGGSKVAALQDRTVTVLDMLTGDELVRREFDFEPHRLTWALDGSAIAVLDDEGAGTVVLLDPDTLATFRTVDLGAPFPIAISLTSTAGHLVATSDTRAPLMFDLDADTVIELADPDTRVLAVKVSVDGDVVVGTDGQQLFSWRSPTKDLITMDLVGDAGGRPSLSLSPDTARAATVTSRGVEVFDLVSGELVAEPVGFVRGLGLVTFVDAETMVATASGGRIYRMRAQGAAVEVLHDGVEGAIVSPDGRAATVVGTGPGSRSIVLDTDGSAVDVGGVPATHRPFGEGMTAIYESEVKRYRVWSGDEVVAEASLQEVILPGSVDGRSVRIGHGLVVLAMRAVENGPPSLNEMVVLEAGTAEVIAAWPAPDDHLGEPLWPDRLLIASIDDTARVTTLAGETVHDLGRHEHPVEAAALASNGDLLLGLGDGSVLRHDGSTFEQLSVQVGPPSSIISLLPFEGGFVAHHATGEVVKWLGDEPEPSGTLYVAPQFAGFGALSSDERLVYMPDGERVVAVPLGIEDWIDQACHRVGTDIDVRSWEAITGSPPEPLEACA